jgi:hypothetical protein
MSLPPRQRLVPRRVWRLCVGNNDTCNSETVRANANARESHANLLEFQYIERVSYR